MRIKGLVLLLQFALIGILLIIFSDGGAVSLQDNYIWISFSILIVLSLPGLISTVLFKKPYFGFTSALSFLIYPLLFLLVYILSKLSGINMQDIGKVVGLLILVLWNILLVIKTTSIDKEVLSKVANTWFLLILVSLALGIGISAVRQPGSVVALDYMQHQAVINQSIHLQRICITPSACSNIFLQNGYTTFYHSVLAFITSFTGNNLEKTIYALDLIWAFLGLVTIFTLFKKFFKRTDLAVLGAILASLVFVNGAYEFNFFLPQTFTFFLFLNFLISKNLTWKKIIIAAVLLVTTHFIIGTVLTFILIIKFFIIDKGFLDLENRGNFRTLSLFAILIALFTILLNLAGFSFENSFQTSEVAFVGSTTNLVPPNNYSFVVNLLGTGFVLFILALAFYFVHKKQNALVTFSVIYILINVSLFFISPTYANKFLIGFGIFSVVIIINYLKEFQFTLLKSAILSTCMVIIFMQPFITNYKVYLQFYTQSDGTVSAVNNRDINFLTSLENLEENCTIISDPFTQSLITGYTNYTTASGQYMSLESRRALLAFITDPNNITLKKVKEISEAKQNNGICFLYTSRVEIGLKPENLNWANNIYILPINNNVPISNMNIKSVITKSNGKLLYNDSYFQLFKL